ncbi:DUF2516 family protein [Streptomyces thermolineatus]|uniref:DUF2516 family protein n=1 Tax=Streptomyces thermolineatus TaxID=44033 RepID=A0ABN3LS10_9ACTN
MNGPLVFAFNSVLGLVSIALFAFTVFAFVDAAVRRADAYPAADKKTKPFWLIVLALSAVVNGWLGAMSFLSIIGLIASIVYVVDVRPALKQVTGGNKGGGRQGPYGPW